MSRSRSDPALRKRIARLEADLIATRSSRDAWRSMAYRMKRRADDATARARAVEFYYRAEFAVSSPISGPLAELLDDANWRDGESHDGDSDQ